MGVLTRYDAAGRVSAEVAPNGAVTTYGYDVLGRRTSVTDALGNVTKFAVGNQVAQWDAKATYTLAGNEQVFIQNHGRSEHRCYEKSP